VGRLGDALRQVWPIQAPPAGWAYPQARMQHALRLAGRAFTTYTQVRGGPLRGAAGQVCTLAPACSHLLPGLPGSPVLPPRARRCDCGCAAQAARVRPVAHLVCCAEAQPDRSGAAAGGVGSRGSSPHERLGAGRGRWRPPVAGGSGC
jgi:hypothetical protein